MKKQELVEYGNLLSDIKRRVRQGQQRAALSANAAMILTYWDIGQMIAQRNLGNMVRFFREYGVPAILQQPVAKFGSDILNLIYQARS